ncbi:hypothetical protein PAXINDRAFT_17046 [Paxillus involutus ATCC 200175]|uniref:Uncharacterized protein n=1 Tax=Paxillus involutus ATCC 200175 TaxID=664439 RepID=A0A0C9TGH5_PAXIN|nr:hypothetical protein PAXINDRAFT_17046 [Paxillus involutus ATCC 200175]
MAPTFALPEAAQGDATVPGMDGFIDSLAVGVVLVVPCPSCWALNDWHGMPVSPETDGADWKYGGDVDRSTNVGPY